MDKFLLTLLFVLAMALITYAIRLLPMLIFRKKINSRFINSVLYYLPYAVLSAMTFPYILYCSGNIISASIGTAVALIGAFSRRSLITVALLATGAVLITEILILII